ncbi:hypothetical protein MMC2321_04592 [Chitinophaga sp. MM2321]
MWRQLHSTFTFEILDLILLFKNFLLPLPSVLKNTIPLNRNVLV